MFEKELTYRKIFLFWLPLAATWLMMAAEGPYLAAIIARLAEPKYNLAAFGVAFSLGIFVEAPIIMIMSASTALVKDWASYIKLRNFTFTLNVVLTMIMILVIVPPVFTVITRKLIGLPPDVATLTHKACLCLIPWPGAIGYRRFYQGVLIRSHLTRRVAFGTIIRLATMSSTALACYLFFPLPGAVVGTLSLSAGVTFEAVASRIMVHKALKELRPETLRDRPPLTLRVIVDFYTPLALTSLLALGILPMVTFFMGKSAMAIESLAVFPVINSLVFLFRCLGISYQEVGIALLGERNEQRKKIERFAVGLGAFVLVAFAAVSFSPLAFTWFHSVSGLSVELTEFAILPTRIMVLMPSLMVLLSYLRAFLVNNKKTRPITLATAIEVGSVVLLLSITIHVLHFVGVIAAAASLLIGRALANVYLVFPFARAAGRHSPIQ